MREITRVTAWAYAGTNYTTELQAVEAAITDVSKVITKDHSSNIRQGIMHNRDWLARLLLRHAELTNVEEPAESKCSGGTRPEMLGGTRTPVADTASPERCQEMTDE